MLTNVDQKFWTPDPDLIARVMAHIPTEAKVLDVGPGTAPFPRADTFVDWSRPNGVPAEKFVRADFNGGPLPFADKSFDFIYCRHTLEDLFNPFLLCSEMARVGKAGYVETPSPLAEMCRGIDGGSPPWRGYIHHRYLVWSAAGMLHFLSKYPAIEYVTIENEAANENRLRAKARYWNTCHLWQNDLPVRFLQHEVDYNVARDYPRIVHEAVAAGIEATDAFMELL